MIQTSLDENSAVNWIVVPSNWFSLFQIPRWSIITTVNRKPEKPRNNGKDNSSKLN